MAMTVLAAVDVECGRIARAPQATGLPGSIADPLSVALVWQEAGAEWVHLVDLDAAHGRGNNADLLAEIVGGLEVNVELAGGICDDSTLRWALSTGCARVVLSTAALSDLEWCCNVIDTHGSRLAVALDVRVENEISAVVSHRLHDRGLDRDGGNLWEAIGRLDQQGCARYVVTDVTRDGALSGVNHGLVSGVASATSASVVASGGISSIQDLLGVAEIASASRNLDGVIVGSALYAGRFTLQEAISAVGGGSIST